MSDTTTVEIEAPSNPLAMEGTGTMKPAPATTKMLLHAPNAPGIAWCGPPRESTSIRDPVRPKDAQEPEHDPVNGTVFTGYVHRLTVTNDAENDNATTSECWLEVLAFVEPNATSETEVTPGIWLPFDSNGEPVLHDDVSPLSVRAALPKGGNVYMASRSKNAAFAFCAYNAVMSAFALNAVFSFFVLQAFFSMFSVNCIFSLASCNSVFSILSLNSVFAIGCNQGYFEICWKENFM